MKPYREAVTDEYVAASVLTFENGDIEAFLLCRGEGMKCQSAANLAPAIAYSGEKPIKSARVVIMRASQWDAIAGDEP